MKTKEFKKIIKEKNIKETLSLYMSGKIFLTEKQLEKVCCLNNGRGGCCFKYKKS